MNKFIRKRFLSVKDSDNISIDVLKKENWKPANFIDIGTKAKVLFGSSSFMTDEGQQKLRSECLKFYITSTKYLLDHLPLHVSVIKHAQYLHPEKANDPGSTSAISNLALSISIIMDNCLGAVFNLDKPAAKEEVCYIIRNQWMQYQNENIPDTYFKQTVEESSSSNRIQDSYWSYALEKCSLTAVQPKNSCYKRIDHYWTKVNEIVNESGLKKYTQLFCLVKCVLSLSHGNAVAERGFSINKLMLECHGYSMKNNTISALHLVKDEIHRVGGVLKFPVTRDLMNQVKGSRGKYIADLEQQKALEEKEKKERENAAAIMEQVQNKKSKLDEVDSEIRKNELSVKAANDIIDDGNKKLQEALSCK